MKKRFTHRLILYNILLFIASICSVSCVNKDNEFDNFFFETVYTKSDTINFNLMDKLNASNQKIIQISSLVFNQTKDVKTLQVLLKIKRDHQKMDAELKKMVEKNLIILPKLAYDFNLNPDSLKGKNSRTYLSKILKNEIQNQVHLWDRMKDKAQNIDFRILSIKSKKTALANNELLKKTFLLP